MRVIFSKTEQPYVYVYIDICLQFDSFFRFLLGMYDIMPSETFLDKVEQFPP